jgi:hypothetical protein
MSKRYNRIPHLQTQNGGTTQTQEENVTVLREGLLPKAPASNIQAPQAGPDPLWPDLTTEELHSALGEMAPSRAPGLDQIRISIIKHAGRVIGFRDILLHLLAHCLRRGYHPKPWRTSTIVVLRKPGKTRYDVVKAYRPIALLNCLGKVLERIVQQRLAFLTQETLPAEQFGSRRGYSAPDAVLHLTHDISTERHQGGGISYPHHGQ